MVNEVSLIARILKAKYFPNKPLWEPRKGYKHSYSWSSIMDAKWIIDKGCVEDWG